MENKKSFSVKKVIILIIVLLIILAAIFGIIIKFSIISKDEAIKAALDDAKLDKTDVSGLIAELDLEDAHFQYEIDFYYNGIEYEYTIQAKNGEIMSRDIDTDGVMTTQTPNPAANEEINSQNIADDVNEINSSEPQQNNEISIDQAKSIVLSDADLTENDAVFTKLQLEIENFRSVYDIEFYTKEKEYDYEISAEDGTILERSSKIYQSYNEDSNLYIGTEKAEKIALDHAGFSEADVQFLKSEFKNDGMPEYEVSFYNNATEYDYDIDAMSGDIIEYDMDIND